MKYLTALLVTVFLLPGCASLSKKECLTADWRTIGYEDGAQGQPRDRIGAHRQACAEYGVTPDLNTYQQGYDQGVLNFCTPHNGFARGQSGSAYSGICPAEVESGFLDGYEAGREIFLQTSESNRLRSELQSIYNRLADIEEDIHIRENKLHADSISKEERRQIHRDIHELKDRQYQLERHYEELLHEKYDVDDRLRFLRRKYSPYK